MILVADSGSSKTDWLLSLPDQEPIEFRCSGLNPYFLTEKQITKIVQEQVPELVAYGPQVTEIYFFGAGCSSPDRHEIVSNALSQVFTKAFISVDSDLLGSAYATCGKEKGFCCVLGTGSNISFFDGEDIHEGKHGLGFVLGDEGSGTWIGKKLVTDYLYGNMPGNIEAAFRKEYDLQKDALMERVYQKPNANTYLASFSRFLALVRDTPYADNLIRDTLQSFIETNIKSYADHQRYKCHFVGSISAVFEHELRTLCAAQHIKVGKIMKHPVNDLLHFILNRE
ncbi:N-acetylglucosamine kinase [Mucilaginibacter sp. KACC 22063]|uniref:N-acetylglucosamine kinase n=1 Tax=Mucilaginibacter sp. KACC 22063 TaxID=3025666 RepID=UPI002366A472|nr:N-acetylglucosamine kinase [Mucilaginibacter sp. KACC 22063]WDF54995.1 N-acetylglucosamine kinase [Mucilaginibacter sp. KACC 22063]